MGAPLSGHGRTRFGAPAHPFSKYKRGHGRTPFFGSRKGSKVIIRSDPSDRPP